jgi:hypothetical protein
MGATKDKSAQLLSRVFLAAVVHIPLWLLSVFLCYVLLALVFQWNLPAWYRAFNFIPIAANVFAIVFTGARAIKAVQNPDEHRAFNKRLASNGLLLFTLSVGIVLWILVFMPAF